MISENEILLKVPLDNELRVEIRRNVESYFSANKPFPPVSYNSLAGLADTLISQYSWDRSYKAFVMVCCGNSIWRTVVGEIPYNRRMLLLPQCLKNSRMCRAEQDELGLLCSECGNCNIAGFLNEAEDLGYITIVSEGTTVASRLVESGSVDAIVGVGCMEVLQKMFSAVKKFSVPAIGVPLLSCGCVDTKADAEWIREELYHIDQHPGFRLMNLNALRSRTDALFTDKQIDRILGLNDSATDAIVREFMLSGGKRIRPLLTVLAYEAFSRDHDEQLLASLAISVECFHKASLIHDDIEDNDLSRYGKETIHARYGIPVAINIGDLLIGEGYRLIAESGLPSKITGELLKVVSQGHRALSDGQGTELLARSEGSILTMDEIISVFENKTSAAFRVSLLMGAVAAGADKDSVDSLIDFSRYIGIAYQLKDDIEDFEPGNENSLQSPSALVSLTAEIAEDAERQQLVIALQTGNSIYVRELAEKYRVYEKVISLLKEYLHKTEVCVSNLQNVRLKLALNEIAGKTFSEYI